MSEEIDMKSVYHDTELLLQQYRWAEWHLEDNIRRLKVCHGQNVDLEELSQMMEHHGATRQDAALADLLKSCEATDKIIHIIDAALESLHINPDYGEEYYRILYYAYIGKKKLTTEKILAVLEQEHNIILGSRWYYTAKKRAILAFGNVLWGYLTKDILNIMKKYLTKNT